ncbi:MAG: hypothetical protein K8U57_24700 [Planctomycetes bacterium]|nr:hypothetical protein [Planctomycetota bacterium]
MSGISPSALETRQVATARVRRMRAARGACWLIVIGLLSVTSVAILDAIVRLPPWSRGLTLAIWLTSVGVLAWRLVFRALRDEPIAQPTREARRELPGNLRAAAAATLALGACLLAGAFVPGAVDQLRRVAVPWHRAASSPYRIVVTSNNPVVRRGGTVTLTAYLKTDTGASSAITATLFCREVGGTVERPFHMIDDGNAAFHFTRVVSADFDYRIEAGGATSDWFTVSAVDPIELTDGTVTETLPPKYVSNTAKSVRQGFAPLEGYQHSTAEFRLRFTRAPKAAWLEFRAEGTTPETRPVSLSDEGLSGTATFRLKQDGTLKLVMVVDQNGRELRLDDPAVTVRVKPDTPPRFEQVSGLSPRPMVARPGERLTLAITATDDIAISSAVLEYAVGAADAPSVSVPIPITGTGTAKATGRLEFDLADKVKLGETLRFRVRVLDSRRLDDVALKPQETTYPESGWATVRIDADALPSEVQEIQGRREYVRLALERALKEIREEMLPAVDHVIEAADKQVLPPEQIFRLNNSRESNKTAVGLLHDAARENALCLELRPLAAALRTVADSSLKEAEEALRQAAIASSLERGMLLASGRKHLVEAGERVEACIARNEQLARDRLDTRALAGFAAEQASLSQRVTNTTPAELAKLQQELLAKFDKLLQESATLRNATEAAKQQEFVRLATHATDLAEMIHEFNDAVQKFQADAKSQAFAAITTDQKVLAANAVVLLARIETAARLANVVLPKAEEFRRVAELVADGKNVEALVEMAQLTLALDAVAATFDKLATDRLDSKAAARQLTLWQDDLRTRFRTATAANPANFATLPAATQASFRTEQAAIKAAATALRVPAGESSTARDTAVEHITSVCNFLNGTGANADRAMEIAVAELTRLAMKLPTIPERLAKTRPEFEKLFREQESIQVGVEAVFRNDPPATFPMKLMPFALRQRKQIAGFAALDLPGFDGRRERTLAALTAATNDLQASLAQDAPASQAWVKREFERWRNVLFDNVPPPDDKTDELARRLEETAKTLQATGSTPTLAANVQDVFKQLGKLTRTPEASALLYDALASTTTADLAFRNNNTKPAELLRKVRTAAEDLARLSDRLNGLESDLDRVRRLSANRRLGAARAKDVPPNSQVNAEVGRELGRELEELSLTRVGFVAQLHKQRLLAEYARLRDKPGADRQAGAHAALATSLDELAALMADIDELTATFERNPPASEPGEADAYLPSKLFADAVRDLARRHRIARERITNIPAELAKWTKPAKTNPLVQIENSQRELAAEVSKLAEGLSAYVGKLPTDPGFAESESFLMADRLRNGLVREARENGERTARLLRKLAGSEHAKGSTALAERQDRILAELAKVATLPGVIAARQRVRSEELAIATEDLVKALEAAARDVGPESPAGKSLLEAANIASGTGKLLREAETKLSTGKVEDAASLREDAEAQIRAAATKVSGVGPMLTTFDAETAALGETLRRTELAMRHLARELVGKYDPVAMAKVMRTVADGLGHAAKVIRERVANDGK